MDPITRYIYDEKEVETLPQDVKQRLVYGSLEELEVEAAAIENFDVQKEAEELKELLDDMERVISMDDPWTGEKFYVVNRAARRQAEKIHRKQASKGRRQKRG